MRRFGMLLFLALGLLAHRALAAPAVVDRSVAAAPLDCVGLAAEAESQYAIPAGLLQAIAIVESGVDGVSWPWSVNAGGEPYYLNSRAEALIVAQAAVDRFGGNVAIGCMQISLRYHRADFTSLNEVLDAPNNVAYAARFLVSLRRGYGSWVAAVMHYHASDPAAQAEYLCRVIRARQILGYQGASVVACR